MSIQHTVVFRLVHEPDSDAERAFIADGRAALTSIPGVENFTIKRQVSDKSKLSWQFSMVFADEQVYEAYNAHPAHVTFVESRWKIEVADFQEFDFVQYE